MKTRSKNSTKKQQRIARMTEKKSRKLNLHLLPNNMLKLPKQPQTNLKRNTMISKKKMPLFKLLRIKKMPSKQTSVLPKLRSKNKKRNSMTWQKTQLVLTSQISPIAL